MPGSPPRRGASPESRARRSLGEGLAHRVAQEDAAELPTERRQLDQLLLQPSPGLRVPLTHVRHQHLAVEDGFTLGKRAIHAEMTRLDAAAEEPRRDARDLERVVV